jgi:hypothetical protein
VISAPGTLPPVSGTDVTISNADPTVPTTGINQGGFDLKAALGRLTPTVVGDPTVQNFSASEMGHTTDGNDQRTWTVHWAPPVIPSRCQFTFNAASNAVDGDGLPSAFDHWNKAAATILVSTTGDSGAPTGLQFQRPLAGHAYLSNTDLAAPGTTIVIGTVVLQVTVNDDTGIDHVELLDGATPIGNANYGGVVMNGTTNLFSLNWDATLKPGSHTLKARAVDCAGNASETTMDLFAL